MKKETGLKKNIKECKITKDVLICLLSFLIGYKILDPLSLFILVFCLILVLKL